MSKVHVFHRLLHGLLVVSLSLKHSDQWRSHGIRCISLRHIVGTVWCLGIAGFLAKDFVQIQWPWGCQGGWHVAWEEWFPWWALGPVWRDDGSQKMPERERELVVMCNHCRRKEAYIRIWFKALPKTTKKLESARTSSQLFQEILNPQKTLQVRERTLIKSLDTINNNKKKRISQCEPQIHCISSDFLVSPSAITRGLLSIRDGHAAVEYVGYTDSI